MKIEIACGTVIRQNEEKVLRALEQHDAPPALAELMEETGLSREQVLRSVAIIGQQASMARARKKYKDFV